MVGLGTLSNSPDATSFGYAVSSDGSTVVGVSGVATFNAAFPRQAEAFRWTEATGMIGLGHLRGGVTSVAYDVSENGSVIVGRSGSSPGQQAFRWTQNSGMVGLGDLPGGAFTSEAYGVSADGTITVGQGISRSGYEAFRRRQGSAMVGLGDLPGGDFLSSASAVSDDGSVVVGDGRSAEGDVGREAFRWTPSSGMAGLGRPEGFEVSRANGVSADGSVVVGDAFSPGNEAIIWDADHGMRLLRDALVNEFGLGVSLAGWTLYSATGVSANGQVIVGYGKNPGGETEAWIARLDASSTLPGDFNHDGTVDAGDYVVWRKRLGTTYIQEHYETWRAHFGQTAGSGASAIGSASDSAELLSAAVPEPATFILIAYATLTFVLLFGQRRRACPSVICPMAIVAIAIATPLSAAIFNVNTVPDLIAAIDAANQNAEPDSIAMAADTTFTLTDINNGTGAGATGLPTITAIEQLTILGNGGVIERSAAAETPAFRLFGVAAGASLAIENLTLQGGLAWSSNWFPSANGGAIHSQGSLALSGVTIQDNIARGARGIGCALCGPGGFGGHGSGGGIYSDGLLLVENSTIRNNDAMGGSGGPSRTSPGRGGNGYGGGIYLGGGAATLHGSIVTSNVARRGDDGDGIGVADGPSGQGIGGGIVIGAGLEVELDEFTLAHVTGNVASTSHQSIHGEFDIIADPTHAPGDFNTDGTVDAADYVVWRKTDGAQAGYDTWRAHFGQTGSTGATAGSSRSTNAAVPESATFAVVALAVTGSRLLMGRRRPALPTNISAQMTATIVLLVGALSSSATMFNVSTVPELIAAIDAANLNNEPDTISLAAGTTFTLTAVNNTTNGATGLPRITAIDELTIFGNGSVIERGTAAETAFVLLVLATIGFLILIGRRKSVCQGVWLISPRCRSLCWVELFLAVRRYLTRVTWVSIGMPAQAPRPVT
jgi:probable HAF family extracellular repeat protein